MKREACGDNGDERRRRPSFPRLRMPRRAIGRCLGLGFLVGLAGFAHATCREDCSDQRQFEMDGCRLQYEVKAPAAAALARCLQKAGEDYRNCVQGCANRDQK